MTALLAALLFFSGARADESFFIQKIPGTSVEFKMIRTGELWVAEYETTWDIYDLYAFGGGDGLDGITAPTQPFVDPTFEYGHDNYPVISVTQHAAKEFCRWLSLKTGRTYRLPTEAEWKSFASANSGAPLNEQAWIKENSQNTPHSVGLKKPNALSLFDIFGNVAEWMHDALVVRGGSWADEAATTSSREPAKPEWSKRDPNFPKSIWWHTDAHHVGFRVVTRL
ncbi:MAG: SUMF1/EgtB/PvdO family nonheme iron enzyme [Bdellovibrionia bacterium]